MFTKRKKRITQLLALTPVGRRKIKTALKFPLERNKDNPEELLRISNQIFEYNSEPIENFTDENKLKEFEERYESYKKFVGVYAEYSPVIQAIRFIDNSPEEHDAILAFCGKENIEYNSSDADNPYWILTKDCNEKINLGDYIAKYSEGVLKAIPGLDIINYHKEKDLVEKNHWKKHLVV